MTRAERRARISAAVWTAETTSGKELRGTRLRATRQEWKETRKGEGWSEPLVEAAVSAGALERVRAAMREGVTHGSKVFLHAMRALGIIDSGRRIEMVYSRYGLDTLPLQKRTYAPARLRESV